MEKLRSLMKTCKFNLLKNKHLPQNSDSWMSTNGFPVLEELQFELKERYHPTHQLRSKLDLIARQYEEEVAALTTHLKILRGEFDNISGILRDYEVCEQLCGSDRELDEEVRELDVFRRKNKDLVEQVASLESEIVTLQELLSKSNAECQRISEMYAARQSVLLEPNEALRTEHADLSTRLQDQEESVQQITKDKLLLEKDLQDTLNNQTKMPMNRSIDVSYTDEEMFSSLDTLNSESKFSQDVRSVATQADVPCQECEKRNAVVPRWSLRKLFWTPLKCLFQLFALLCFICTIFILYRVTTWVGAQEIMDMLLKVEYVADVPK